MGSRRGTIAAVAVAIALAAAASVGLLVARSSGLDAADHREAERSVRVLELRTASERAHLDEANTALLHDAFHLAPTSAATAATERRVAARRSTLHGLRLVAEGTDPAARDASDLVRVLENDGIGARRRVTPDELITEADFDISVGQGTRRRPRLLRSDLETLARSASVGGWTLSRGIDVAYLRGRPEVPSRLADYFALAERFATSGGYLGDDPAHPLVDSAYVDGNLPRSAPVRAIDRATAASPIATYDAWLTRWSDDAFQAGSPPLDLAVLRAEAAQLDRQVRAIVDRELGGERRSQHLQAQAAQRRHDRALAVALVSVGLLGALGLGAVVLVVRRARTHERLATTDPLTGAGNRRMLDGQTSERLADPELAWHLVAAIDLDRFKLVNDTWGHALGDAVLVRVTQELHAVRNRLCRVDTSVAGEVVRMGGDEFLLALHGNGPRPEDDVRQRLDEVRKISLHTADGHAVPLAFSIGIAVIDGPGDLETLLAQADLASYEDKAQRARRASDRRAPDGSASDGAAHAGQVTLSASGRDGDAPEAASSPASS